MIVTTGPWFPPHSNGPRALPSTGWSPCQIALKVSRNPRNFCPKPNQSFVLKAFALKASQLLCNKKESIFCFYFWTNPHEEAVVQDLGSVEVSGWHRSNERPIGGLAVSDHVVCLQRSCDSGGLMALHYPPEQPSQVWCQAVQVLLSCKTDSVLLIQLLFGKKIAQPFTDSDSLVISKVESENGNSQMVSVGTKWVCTFLCALRNVWGSIQLHTEERWRAANSSMTASKY